MFRYTLIIVALTMCVTAGRSPQIEPGDVRDIINGVGAVTMALTNLDASDTVLELSYQIRNHSQNCVWILTGIGKNDVSADVFVDEDGRTLLLSRRLDLPASKGASGHSFHGRYVRLRPGEVQTEWICLGLPVHLSDGPMGGQRTGDLKYARRLGIEIGYYGGDLPEMICDMLEEREQLGEGKRGSTLTLAKNWFIGGLLTFNERNETLNSRDDEVLIPYTNQTLKGEQALQITINDLRIPYEEKEVRSRVPDLSPCTRVEIRYQPSALEYFFPFAGQQVLLSTSEKEYLRTVRTIVVADTELIKALVDDVASAVLTTGIVRAKSAAYVVGYLDEKRVSSFPIYNAESVVTNERHRFTREDGFQSLRLLTPRIQSLGLRTGCAANLRNLWYRLRLYERAEKVRLKQLLGESQMLYPAPTRWCDAMVSAYESIGMLEHWILRPHKCPGSSEGQNDYAMNPNCKPDSLADMVLLFEAKVGWNQHGGPELFTFDNHDPKGGCVLLNNGTVKFIRTQEELEQLRWK